MPSLGATMTLPQVWAQLLWLMWCTMNTVDPHLGSASVDFCGYVKRTVFRTSKSAVTTVSLAVLHQQCNLVAVMQSSVIASLCGC